MISIVTDVRIPSGSRLTRAAFSSFIYRRLIDEAKRRMNESIYGFVERTLFMCPVDVRNLKRGTNKLTKLYRR